LGDGVGRWVSEGVGVKGRNGPNIVHIYE
jgi:hypothetical protein